MNEKTPLNNLDIYYITIACNYMTRIYIQEKRTLQPGVAITPSGIEHAIQGLEDDYLLEKLLKFCKFWHFWVGTATGEGFGVFWELEEIYYYMAIVINDYIDELEEMGMNEAYPIQTENLIRVIEKIREYPDDNIY
jgi:hypothetical protein